MPNILRLIRAYWRSLVRGESHDVSHPGTFDNEEVTDKLLISQTHYFGDVARSCCASSTRSRPSAASASPTSRRATTTTTALSGGDEAQRAPRAGGGPEGWRGTLAARSERRSEEADEPRARGVLRRGGDKHGDKTRTIRT